MYFYYKMINNKEFSLDYEILCINYHQNHYDQKTFHWKYIPEDILLESGFIHNYNEYRLKRKLKWDEKKYNFLQEYGLDGISVENNDNNIICNGIQCKFYDKTIITAKHLGTFLSVINNRLRMKNNNSKGYLYYTSKLEINLKEDFQNSKGIMNPIKLPFMNEIKDENKDESKYELRNFQKDALNKLLTEWNGIKSLILPCGTGKTTIVANYLKNSQYKNIFIISPLRILTKQNFDRISKFLPEYKNLLVDSDEDGTRDFNDIKNIFNEKSFISSTYKSCEDILVQLFEDYEEDDKEDTESNFSNESKYYEKFDLSNSILIVDEAHNIINNKKLIKIINSFPKVLLMTATPPIILEDLFNCSNIYQYNMSEAIQNKYICDYQIYLPLLETNNDVKDNIEIPKELLKLDKNLCKKGLFLINGLKKTGSKYCIVYMSSIEECNQFKKVIDKIMTEYHYTLCDIFIINSEFKQKDRDEILNKFQEIHNDDRIKILLSIRILDEGIDINICDSIFITNIGEYTSDIKTVQRICRANRLDKNNINKIANIFLWTDEFNKITNCLELLKENDVEFHKKIKMINSNYDKNHLKEIKEKEIVYNNDFQKYISIKCKSLKEIRDEKINLLFKYVDSYNKIPRQIDIFENINIGHFYNSLKQKLNSKDSVLYIKLSENQIIKENLDEFLQYKENEISIEKKIEILIDFCNQKNRVPKSREYYKNIKIGYFYQDYKRKVNIKQDEIYKKLLNNQIIKNNINEYFEKQEKNKEKINLSIEEKKEMLLDFIKEKNRVPMTKEEHKCVKLGQFYEGLKLKIYLNNNKELYQELIKNNYIKDDINKYLKNKEKNNKKEKLSVDEKILILFDYIKNNNKTPTHNIEYKNQNIGLFYTNLKRKIKSKDDELYIQLSKNEIIKENLDEYLFKKNKKIVLN